MTLNCLGRNTMRQFLVRIPMSINRLTGLFHRELTSIKTFKTNLEALHGLPYELELIKERVNDDYSLFIVDQHGRISSPNLISLLTKST